MRLKLKKNEGVCMSRKDNRIFRRAKILSSNTLSREFQSSKIAKLEEKLNNVRSLLREQERIIFNAECKEQELRKEFKKLYSELDHIKSLYTEGSEEVIDANNYLKRNNMKTFYMDLDLLDGSTIRITVITNDKDIFVAYDEYTAIAKTHPDDEYEYEVGLGLAINRLLNQIYKNQM
jgi:hypothetical protein